MASKKYDGTWMRRIPCSIEDEDALSSILECEGLVGMALTLGRDKAGIFYGNFGPKLRENEVYRYFWDEQGRLHGWLNVTYDFAACMWSEKDAAKYARLGVTGEEYLCLEIRLWIEDNQAGMWMECDEPYRIGWELVDVQDQTVLSSPMTGYYPKLPRLKRFPA